MKLAAGNIELRGVSVHNLKHVDLDIPHQRLVVMCGVSGSGKTSLAFDTLYVEAQRRYIESLSLYSRQFLERLDKPEAERIEGIPAAVAVTRRETLRAGRTTIAAATEINDYLRVLFGKLGKLDCPNCHQPVVRSSPAAASDQLLDLGLAARAMIAFSAAGSEAAGEPLKTRLPAQGFVRVIVNGRTANLADVSEQELGPEPVLVVVDRVVASEAAAQRIRESLETAFAAGGGGAVVLLAGDAEPAAREQANASAAGVQMIVDGQAWRRFDFTNRLECTRCRRQFADPDPQRFNSQSPLGACPACHGTGEVALEGPARQRPRFRACGVCQGTKLNEEALSWRINGRNIAAITQLTIREALALLPAWPLNETQRQIAAPVVAQVVSRLDFLTRVGLEYLALDRTFDSLSGGEAQRVTLTAVLGSQLVNMLYVLDEPSVGLHPSDTARLVECVKKLREHGNTVVVVEHEEAMLRAAEQLVEIGPGAGDSGGQVVFQGTLDEMLVPGASLTGEYLAGRRGISLPASRRPATRGRIKLFGACGNNLKNVTVEFPLGVLCLVTGVSGAGKSTLVQDTLYGALCRRKGQEAEALAYEEIVGDGQIDDVILVDQDPIGRSSRSNPVTYIKAYDQIRNVFAETVDARTRNYSPGQFSFNVEGGRCNGCEGMGQIRVDMQFMDDIYMPCAQCGGTRFRQEILAVKYRGQSIAEVLAMTVREAFGFFRGQAKVQGRLKQLIDVGLDYLQLGQPANTLSTGEAQRLKLAAHLSEATRNRTLFLLDEPTTGLHFADIVTLLDCFEALLSVGHSLIVIEHNLQLMRAADYIIDLGPGAAAEGGQVVACGTPEEIAGCFSSITGRYLAQSLVACH